MKKQFIVDASTPQSETADIIELQKLVNHHDWLIADEEELAGNLRLYKLEKNDSQ